MKIDRMSPVELTDEVRKQLVNLLRCSWSAEQSLRLVPLVEDEDYPHHAVQWTLPQGYHTIAYMLRAILLTEGHKSSAEIIGKFNEPRDESGSFYTQRLVLIAAFNTLHKWGFYEDTEVGIDYLLFLSPDPTGMLSFGPKEIIAEQENIITRVAILQEQHERYMRHYLGDDTYLEIIGEMSEAIQKFVGDRYMDMKPLMSEVV